MSRAGFARGATFLLAALMSVPAVASACSAAPSSAQSLLDASIRGRALVREAVVRIGGAERIGGIRRLFQAMEGEVSNGLQAYDPAHVDTPDLRRHFAQSWELDLETRRHRRDSALRFDGATVNFVDVYADGRVWTASPDRTLIWTRDGSEGAFVDSRFRYAPPLLLARALGALATAIWAGEDCRSGALADLVDFSLNDRVRLRLHIGREDKRLRRLEATAADPLTGDDTASYDYEGERIVEGISFPTRIVHRRRGTVFSDTRFTRIEVNPVFDAVLYSPQLGLIEVPPAGAAYAIGDGVYEMVLGDGTDNYVQFFDLGDSVAVFDAPLSDEVSQRIAQQVRATLGAKPIRYVVLSHFHDDHLGGVGYFVRLGARIVTTRDSAAVIARYVNATSRLSGTAPAPNRPIDFLFVDDAQLTLEGSARSLTVFRLTNLPHVRSMLVAHYPPASLMVNADLFSELAPFDDNSLLFAQWLRQPGAPRADWVAGGHHRRVPAGTLQAEALVYQRAAHPAVGAQ